MKDILVKNNNIQLRIYEVLNNSGTLCVGRCYMLDKADASMRFSYLEYGDEKDKRAITYYEGAESHPYDFEESERLYPSKNIKDKLQGLSGASSCIHCLFHYNESVIVPNPAHPMYLRWAYKIYDGEPSTDNHHRQHEIQQQIYLDVAEGRALPPFVQCICSRCKTEWIIFEKQRGDYKRQIFEQLVASGVKGKPEQKAANETMAVWTHDTWYLDDDGVLTFHARRGHYNFYKPISYPEYKWDGEIKREDRYKPGTAEGG